MQTLQIAIIGAGPAGCAAAVQCKRLGIEPTLYEKSHLIGGLIANAYSIENYPGFLAPVSGIAFASLLEDYLARFGIAPIQKAIAAIHRTNSGFVLEGQGEQVEARAVILATGTQSCAIEALMPLSSGPLYADIVSMPRPFPSKVLVVGGGEAAFDYSLSLLAGGSRVTVACRSHEPRCRGVLRSRVENQPDIRIFAGYSPASAYIQDNLIRVVLAPTSAEGSEPLEVECDAVLTAVGRRSRPASITSSLGDLALTGFRTNIPGLYVAGDARLGSLGQVAAAVGDGLLCAMAAVQHVSENS